MKDNFNDLTYEELVQKRIDLRQKHIDIRMNKVLGHVENPLEERILRKQIATLNTIIHEYALEIRKG